MIILILTCCMFKEAPDQGNSYHFPQSQRRRWRRRDPFHQFWRTKKRCVLSFNANDAKETHFANSEEEKNVVLFLSMLMMPKRPMSPILKKKKTLCSLFQCHYQPFPEIFSRLMWQSILFIDHLQNVIFVMNEITSGNFHDCWCHISCASPQQADESLSCRTVGRSLSARSHPQSTRTTGRLSTCWC